MGLKTFFGRLGQGLRGKRIGFGWFETALEVAVAALVFFRLFKMLFRRYKG